MNDIIRSLFKRKSIRAFENRDIQPAAKEAILRAATEAPTAGNQQLYTILDITDQAVKDRLAVTCDNQPFIAKAKMVLVFCADCQKWYDAYIATGCNPRVPGVGDLLLAVSDANIAAQNAVVAAQSFGIGSCYIGDIMENCEIHRELFNLPDYVFPCCMLVFGYPTPQQRDHAKPERVKLKHIVHENTYRRMDNHEIEEMFSPRTGEKKYTDWMRAFCDRKYNSDFSKEMSRSVEKYLQSFLSDK